MRETLLQSGVRSDAHTGPTDVAPHRLTDDAILGLLERAERNDDPELRRCAAVVRRRLKRPQPGVERAKVRYVDLRAIVCGSVAQLPEQDRLSVGLDVPDHPVVVHIDAAAAERALQDLLVQLLDQTGESIVALQVVGRPGGADLLSGASVVVLTVSAAHRRLSGAELVRAGWRLAATNPAHHGSPVLVCQAGTTSFVGQHLSVESDSAGTRVRASWPLDLG